MRITRRAFLAAGAAGAAAAAGLDRDSPAEPRGPLVDFHVHLFGVGDGGSGCVLSPRQKRHVNYRYFLSLLDLEENGRLDQDYVDRLVTQVRASSVKKAVLLAQDCRYDANGRPDLANTPAYIPNDYLLQTAGRFPDLFVPCPSINPRRADALDELERCAARGARVVKIHPPTQDVDPGDASFRPFYRRAAERGIILLVHTGGEHAAEVTTHDFSDPRRLVTALEEGCTVVAAHSGLGNFFDGIDFLPGLVELLRRYPRLYCETAAHGTMFRWRNLPRLLREPEVTARLIHASDFPFPPNALVFWNRLRPARLFSLLAERNLIERDYRLKQRWACRPRCSSAAPVYWAWPDAQTPHAP